MGLFGLGAVGERRQASRSSPPPRCDFDVRQSPFAKHCTLLQNVCLDQGRAILYDAKHRPPHGDNGPPLGLPTIKPSARQTPYHFPYAAEGGQHLFAPFPGIPVRAASRREPRRYLQEPSFSNCTVPIAFWPHYDFNFVHNFRDNAALMYSALQETPWADHARVLLMTGEGLALSGMNQQLWQPLSEMRVDSFEEATVRLRDDEIGTEAVAEGEAVPPASSYEGGERRCFAAMYACTQDVAGERGFQLHAYGRHLAAWYGQHKAREVGAARAAMLAGVAPDLPPPPAASALRTLGFASKGEHGGGEVRLRVVFQQRDKTRLLVNLAELLERCNGWSYRAPSGATVRALCWQVEIPDLMTGIVAAQEADIFVAAHGANTANAWLMRPGSSLIELTPFEFDENCSEKECAHANVPIKNAKDADSQLLVFKLLSCDPEGSWTPGKKEAAALEDAAGKGQAAAPDADRSKHRNLIVRWEALAVALEAAVDTAGDMRAYRRRYEDGTWWWLASATQTVPAGPAMRETTCSKARAAGVIE